MMEYKQGDKVQCRYTDRLGNETYQGTFGIVSQVLPDGQYLVTKVPENNQTIIQPGENLMAGWKRKY